MADQNKPQDDLSIEEILGSIRRIIAEDDEETPATAAETKSAEPESIQLEDQIEMQEEIEEEPLELTNRIEPDGTIIDTVPAEIAEPEDELILQDSSEPESVYTPSETEYAEKIILVEEPMAMTEEEPISTESLLSPTTTEATAAVMAKLARHTALMEDGNGSNNASGPTIESIVREMLRPMLKSWLDDNLPGMVQKIVEREIERLTKSL